MRILKNGSLRFWGDWFGRPYDNLHRVVTVEYDKNEAVLVICFDHEEKCTVYNPIDVINNKNTFYISKATRIVWEWYPYGKEHVPLNLCQIIYSQTDKTMIVKEYSNNMKEITKSFDSNNHYALEIC